MENRKELKEYRTSNSKHYLKKDGTIEVEIYHDPIHYLNNGKYEEIDNTLVTNDKGYINNQNDFKVQFHDCVDTELLSVSLDDNYLSMSFLDGHPTLNINNKRISFILYTKIYLGTFASGFSFFIFIKYIQISLIKI